jgi:DNA-binding transcriptional LysR family regulator
VDGLGGIAQLPLVVANPLVAQRRGVPVLAEWTPPRVPVHALFPGTRYLTPKVRLFVDHAMTAFERDTE